MDENEGRQVMAEIGVIEKEWWRSRGVWGGLVSAVAGVAALLGYAMSEDLQLQVVELILAVVGLAAGSGGILATVGRLKAETKIAKAGGPSTIKGLLVLAVAVPALLLAGCAGMRTNADPGAAAGVTTDSSVVAQLPGVIEALADVAMTAPVDAETRAQLKEYVEMAKDAAATISAATSSDADTLTRLVNVVRGVAAIVDKSAADSGTKTQVSNYVAWAVFGVRMASVVGAVI